MDKKQLRKPIEAHKVFRRATDDTNKMEHMDVFLCIALYEGSSLSALRDQLDLPLNTLSKYVRRLLDSGKGVIKLEVDQTDTRTKLVKLTPKGQKLAEELAEILK